MFFKFPDILKKFYPDAIWTLPSESENVKDVYLTFDDGPTKGVTDWVLDLLMKHGVKATFFCLGKNIETNPDLLRRISAEGHTAANHTFNHLNGWKNSTQKYLYDISLCEKFALKNYFRPPYGKLSPMQYLKLKKKYKIIFWDLLSYDFQNTVSPSVSIEKIKQYSRNGSIIVFHDSLKAEKNLKLILPGVLNYLKAEGFSFRAM